MKVFLLLNYDSLNNCRVHSIYTKLESAIKRGKNEEKRPESGSWHIIKKTLKGFKKNMPPCKHNPRLASTV